MKIPGPDHPITLTSSPARWRATFQGAVIADSVDVVILAEAAYPPVVYFPRADVDMTRLTPTPRSTHCPYKGDAGYFSISGEGPSGDNAVWTYETPYPTMAQIAGRLAFYADRVTISVVEN